MKLLGVIFLALLLLSGCTTVSKNVKLVTENSNEAAVLLVYRESAFQAGAVSLYIGKNDEYFLELANDEFGLVKIDAGKYFIQAKASGSPSSEIEVDLVANQTTCLASIPNPEMLGATIIPLVANMVPTFVLEKVTCPSEEALKNLSRVGL